MLGTKAVHCQDFGRGKALHAPHAGSALPVHLSTRCTKVQA
jgi:hypothetical protein